MTASPQEPPWAASPLADLERPPMTYRVSAVRPRRDRRPDRSRAEGRGRHARPCRRRVERGRPRDAAAHLDVARGDTGGCWGDAAADGGRSASTSAWRGTSTTSSPLCSMPACASCRSSWGDAGELIGAAYDGGAVVCATVGTAEEARAAAAVGADVVVAQGWGQAGTSGEPSPPWRSSPASSMRSPRFWRRRGRHRRRPRSRSNARTRRRGRLGGDTRPGNGRAARRPGRGPAKRTSRRNGPTALR